MDFISKMKAEKEKMLEQAATAVKAGVAKVESMSVESIESSVVGKMNQAFEKVENAGAAMSKGGTPAKVKGATVGTPAKASDTGTPSTGKRTLDSLGRDELLLIVQRELKRSKELSARAEAAQSEAATAQRERDDAHHARDEALARATALEEAAHAPSSAQESAPAAEELRTLREEVDAARAACSDMKAALEEATRAKSEAESVAAELRRSLQEATEQSAQQPDAPAGAQNAEELLERLAAAERAQADAEERAAGNLQQLQAAGKEPCSWRCVPQPCRLVCAAHP